MVVDAEKIDALRCVVCETLSSYRAEHVLSVEKEAVRLAEIYLPEFVQKARISALLHDITKEYDVKKQLQIFAEFGIIIDNVTLCCPSVFHSKTAALLIPQMYPDFADPDILSAVAKHTTGSEEMSVLDCIIYLADFIEPLRKFEDCKKLRAYFWNGIREADAKEAREFHLYRTMVRSFDLTIRDLMDRGSVIAPDMFRARNAFLLKLESEQRQ